MSNAPQHHLESCLTDKLSRQHWFLAQAVPRCKLFYIVIFPPMWRRKHVFPFFHSQTLKPSPSFPWQKPPSVYVGTTFVQNVFLRWRRWHFFPHLFVCFARSLPAAPLWCDGVCGLRHRPLRVSLQQANRKSANIFISKYANIVNWKSTIMFTVLSNIVIRDLFAEAGYK